MVFIVLRSSIKQFEIGFEKEVCKQFDLVLSGI